MTAESPASAVLAGDEAQQQETKMSYERMVTVPAHYLSMLMHGSRLYSFNVRLLEIAGMSMGGTNWELRKKARDLEAEIELLLERQRAIIEEVCREVFPPTEEPKDVEEDCA